MGERPLRRNQAGFTLIEVVISTALVAVIGLGVSKLLLSAVQTQQNVTITSDILNLRTRISLIAKDPSVCFTLLADPLNKIDLTGTPQQVKLHVVGQVLDNSPTVYTDPGTGDKFKITSVRLTSKQKLESTYLSTGGVILPVDTYLASVDLDVVKSDPLNQVLGSNSKTISVDVAVEVDQGASGNNVDIKGCRGTDQKPMFKETFNATVGIPCPLDPSNVTCVNRNPLSSPYVIPGTHLFCALSHTETNLLPRPCMVKADTLGNWTFSWFPTQKCAATCYDYK